MKRKTRKDKTVYPTVADILQNNRNVTEGEGTGLHVGGRGKIEAALGRIENEYYGKNLYPCLFSKASALLHSLVTTHPFDDGNKRTGIISCLHFLYINGLSDEHGISDEDIADVVKKLSDNKLTQEELFQWLRNTFGKHVTGEAVSDGAIQELSDKTAKRHEKLIQILKDFDNE